MKKITTTFDKLFNNKHDSNKLYKLEEKNELEKNKVQDKDILETAENNIKEINKLADTGNNIFKEVENINKNLNIDELTDSGKKLADSGKKLADTGKEIFNKLFKGGNTSITLEDIKQNTGDDILHNILNIFMSVMLFEDILTGTFNINDYLYDILKVINLIQI